MNATARFKLIIAFDGSRYAGWQVQKTGVGVQEKVEEAFLKVMGLPVRLHGSSRTDAGVHARAMCAHVEAPHRFSPEKLRLALNAYLPEDIRVMDVKRCAPDFHARFDAAGKEYRYFVWNFPAMDPLLRHQAWHVTRPLHLEKMRAAAALLPGRRDFKVFAATRNYEMESTVRTLNCCRIRKQGWLLTFTLDGDGFLYKMCRGIVGTLVEVGLGKRSPEEVGRMLEGRKRELAGMTAPAHGLVLWKVRYNRPGQGKRNP